MSFKKLNYQKLMKHNPTEYDRVVNHLGQEIVFYEHPSLGDEYPVIAVFHDKELAFCTDFYDTEDFYQGSEYMPVVVENEMFSFYEIS